MKIYRNTKEILRKDTMGRRFSLAGLGILADWAWSLVLRQAGIHPRIQRPAAQLPHFSTTIGR